MPSTVQITTPFQGTETELQATAKFIFILLQKFGGGIGPSIITHGDIRRLLNRNAPVEYQIGERENQVDFIQKLNEYHIFLPQLLVISGGEAVTDYLDANTYDGGLAGTDYTGLPTLQGGIQ